MVIRVPVRGRGSCETGRVLLTGIGVELVRHQAGEEGRGALAPK